MWNGAVMLRTAMLYPDEARADEWRDKGTRFLVNAISVDADATCRDEIAGKPVSDWYVGSNFFDSYTGGYSEYAACFA